MVIRLSHSTIVSSNTSVFSEAKSEYSHMFGVILEAGNKLCRFNLSCADFMDCGEEGEPNEGKKESKYLFALK